MSSNTNNNTNISDFATANYSNGLLKSIGAELGVMFGFIGLFILTYIVFHIIFKITLGDEDKTLHSMLDVDSGKGKNIDEQPNRQIKMNLEQRRPDERPTEDTQAMQVVSLDESLKPTTRVTDDNQATKAQSQDNVDKIESISPICKDRL